MTFGQTRVKPIPPNIVASGPEGTQWFGGPVDRSTMSLRIDCSAEECATVSELLGYVTDEAMKRWRLKAPDSVDADLDAQVHWILSRLTSDFQIWRQLTSKYKVDLFCGLFLE